jgi:His/Glu/Gln/Arg/opine family amino acid ABC transporter permease subunit
MMPLQYAGLLLKAAGITIWISWLALVIAALVGGVVGIARSSRWRSLRWAALIYTEAFRSIPMIVLMFFCYFGVPLFLRIDLPPFAAATLALALVGSSLMAEVVRGGIDSVGRGQWDAARAAGLRDFQIMRLIVGPQALRVMLPPSVGVYVATLKDSSIASIIGYVELTKTGLLIRDSVGHGFEILAYVALMYFAINYAISLGGHALERRYRIVGH